MEFRIVLAVVFVIIGISATLGIMELSSNSHVVNDVEKGEYYPIVVKDGLGQEVEISQFPSRIVSLAPSDTQILVSLGLGKYIAGADCYSYQLLNELNETSLIKNAHVITNIYPLNVTGVKLINPSVVVADAGLEGSDYSKLESAGLKTFFVRGDLDVNFHQIEDDVMTTATVFDMVPQGEQVVSWMNEKVDQFSSNQTVGSVAYVLFLCQDYTFYTVGGNTFITNIMYHAGATNVFASQSGYPLDHISQLIEANPNVIVFTEMYNTSYTQHMIQSMLNQYPALNNVTAFKQDRIYILDQGLPVSIINEPAPLSVYGIEIFHDIMEGTAPKVINQTWVESELNATLPVF
jgi:iron complex transport system substrate-binding protein